MEFRITRKKIYTSIIVLGICTFFGSYISAHYACLKYACSALDSTSMSNSLFFFGFPLAALSYIFMSIMQKRNISIKTKKKTKRGINGKRRKK